MVMDSQSNPFAGNRADLAALWTPDPSEKDPDYFVARGLLLSFWNGVALEIRTRGKCLIGANLIKALFEDAVGGGAPDLATLDHVAIEKAGARATLHRSTGIVVFRKHHDSAEWQKAGGDYLRVNGGNYCDGCKFEFRDHPLDLEVEFVRVLCDGRRVKL